MKKKHSVINKIKQYLIINNTSFDNTDGVKVNTSSGWWLIRSSNTEEIISICCEGTDNEQLKTIRSNIDSMLNLIM
ncbi:MAG: hypothetical protein HRK26_05655 [Rickettsiaceae bacterium H1]|nr:hypothetical protein [Rickettsiaceae bacterium H1]